MMPFASKLDAPLDPAISLDEVAVSHELLKQNLAEFFSNLDGEGNSDTKPDVFPLVYSDIALPGFRTGGALWGDVTMHDRHYYIPNDEAEIFGRHRAYLQQLFVNPPTVYEFGPGDVLTLARKTMQIVDAVDARRYFAVDVNADFATKSARHVSISKPDISTDFIYGDYTKPHKLDTDGTTSLGLLLGCSANQHRITNAGREGEVTFKDLLKNFGEMLDYNALLIITTDANTSAVNANDCYSGAQVKAFLSNWLPAVAAHLSYDSDPENNCVLVNGKPLTESKISPVLANSRYEPFPMRSGGRTIHSLVVLQPIEIRIDGKSYHIMPGKQLDLGSSEKWAMSSIKKEINRTGDWTVVKTLSTGRSVQAIVLAGKDTPPEQIALARRQVAEWSTIERTNGGSVASRNTATLQRRQSLVAGAQAT